MEDYLTLGQVRLIELGTWMSQSQGFSFVLIKNGRGHYLSGAGRKPLFPGDVLFTKSSQNGRISVSAEELRFWHFCLSPEHLLPLFDADEICLLQDATQNLRFPKLYPAASHLAIECHKLAAAAPLKGNVDHRSHVLRIAAAVLSTEFKSVRLERSPFAKTSEHFIQMFKQMSASELSCLCVGEIARKFGCSQRHLNRIFHQHFGHSVGTLKMEMRLLKASSLLRDPDMKIGAVAEQCGFRHQGLFCIRFKRRFGSTPGEWRRRAANEPAAVSGFHDDSAELSRGAAERGTEGSQKETSTKGYGFMENLRPWNVLSSGQLSRTSLDPAKPVAAAASEGRV
jgi:AraC-like DNA-binding protein